MLKLIYIHNPQWILKDSKRLDMYIIDDIIIKFFFNKNILENQSHIKEFANTAQLRKINGVDLANFLCEIACSYKIWTLVCISLVFHKNKQH